MKILPTTLSHSQVFPNLSTGPLISYPPSHLDFTLPTSPRPTRDQVWCSATVGQVRLSLEDKSELSESYSNAKYVHAPYPLTYTPPSHVHPNLITSPDPINYTPTSQLVTGDKIRPDQIIHPINNCSCTLLGK